jgi:hypothetical protein
MPAVKSAAAMKIGQLRDKEKNKKEGGEHQEKRKQQRQ